MVVFWENGYADTSIEQLVERTGVSRYGLYAEFGSKWDLFLAALDRYEEQLIGARLVDMQKPDAALASIDAFFAFIEISATSPASQYGCFMCNTATELGRSTPQTSKRIDHYFSNLRAAFENALRGAIEAGEIEADADVEMLAEHLTTSAVGTFVLMKSSKSRSMIAGSIRALRAVLPTTDR